MQAADGMASADLIVVSTDGASFSDVEGYMQHVSELRRSRIAKKRCDGDKLSALAAGLLVSMELSRRSGIPGSRLRYSHGAFGKPYLKGAEVYFSLSHTNGAVCAAFSDAEIGADIERRDRRVGERLYSGCSATVKGCRCTPQRISYACGCRRRRS